MKSVRLKIVFLILLCLVAGVGWTVYTRLQEGNKGPAKRQGPGAVAVEVAPVVRGPIVLERIFSGTLEAAAKFVVAPKTGGLLERLNVDIGDMVQKGQVVAMLDDDEFVQAVAQADADLAVANANFIEAKSALEIAERELKRIQTLRQSGISSASQFDAAVADQLAKKAKLAVARAHVAKSEASLAAAKIRKGYTRITAEWNGGNDGRIVAERFVDEGDTVASGKGLLTIVELDPIIGVIFVTEKDYARLEKNQVVALRTDAFPDEKFQGRIARIAPVFQQASRQARVELTIDNADHRLKPGMFIRVTLVLDRVENAIIVPEHAITQREEKYGLFVVEADGTAVRWQNVGLGIRSGGKVQVITDELDGRVVTLGQQLLKDGSRIIIPEAGDRATSSRKGQPRS